MAKKKTTKKKENKIADKSWIKRALNRICHEILEWNHGAKDLAFVGIRTGGEYLAARMQKIINEIEKVKCPLGLLDITLYRDDLNTIGPVPLVKGTEMNFDIEGKTIILVDDVLFTGRTVRAAMDEIMEFGRPKAIKLAVLVDRDGRELPIQADFLGKKVEASSNQAVEIRLKENNGGDEVVVF